jgi:hypothetical protein
MFNFKSVPGSGPGADLTGYVGPGSGCNRLQQSVAPAERKADHKFGCKVRLNPTLDVASVKLKVF